MKRNKLVFALIIAGITANAVAAPTPKPPPAPQDVNVVNTPTVTVTNPQTSVTVNNVNPIPVNVQNQSSSTTSIQFVGFSTNTHTGGDGVLSFTKSCQLDYPGSRMCTSEELLNTTNVPLNIPVGNAWIRPVFQPHTSQSSSNNTKVVDVSGVISEPSYMNCFQWSDNGGANGLAVSERGIIHRGNCNTSQPIACCLPQ